MKYHYLKGRHYTFGENVGRSMWLLLAVVVAILLWDVLFNDLDWFIKLVIWSSERI